MSSAFRRMKWKETIVFDCTRQTRDSLNVKQVEDGAATCCRFPALFCSMRRKKFISFFFFCIVNRLLGILLTVNDNDDAIWNVKVAPIGSFPWRPLNSRTLNSTRLPPERLLARLSLPLLFILFKSVEAECRVRRPSPSENGCVDFNVYVSVYSVGAVCFFQGWPRRKMISTRKTVFIASFQTKHVVHFKGQPFSGALLLRMCHSWFHPKKAGRSTSLLINRRWLHFDETCLAVCVWQCERNANWTCSSLWTAQRWRRLVAPG